MTWASDHISKLKRGQSVTFKARGKSMQGAISDGQVVTLVPVARPLQVGDIVLCRVHGHEYLHKITSMRKKADDSPGQFQIGNMHGVINGWVARDKIYGLYERPGKPPAPAEPTKDGEPELPPAA